tara:strand:- start:317 stop:526 length:210 start_codon:yes stop_codon:yes gene_type:complete
MGNGQRGESVAIIMAGFQALILTSRSITASADLPTFGEPANGLRSAHMDYGVETNDIDFYARVWLNWTP